MSYTSPTDRPTSTSPATTGTQQTHSYPSGASAASSSRPGTASAVARTDPHGIHGGGPPGRSLAEASGGVGAPGSDRRHSTELAAQTPSRAFGVHSILNPQAEPDEREGSGIRLPPPPAMSVTTQTLLPAPTESPRSRKRTDPRSPVRDHDYPPSARLGRRVLTPKSPAVRAASLGARRNPAFHSTIQPLQHIPGTTGRTYTAEPGPYRSSEIPPLPSLAIATGPNPPSYGQYDPTQPRSAHVAESPVARGADPTMTPQTEHSVSSQTPFGKMEQQSPMYRYGGGGPSQAPPGSLRVLSAGGGGGVGERGGGYGQESHVHGPHEGYQAGHASYQMTLDTDQGPMVVPVELDLQQASKVADEKRKRNAGASARFRARRKEKEKEASTTISGLQGELRDLMDERDFYIAERNFYRDLASRHIPASQMPPRPSSPLHRRSGHGGGGPGSSTSESMPLPSDEPPYQQQHQHQQQQQQHHQRSESGSTSQRRRTGDYQPSFIGGGHHATQSPPVSGYGSAFPSAPPISLPPPPPTTAYGTPRSLPPGPPLGPQITRSQSYDPLRRDHPYDRNWSSGR